MTLTPRLNGSKVAFKLPPDHVAHQLGFRAQVDIARELAGLNFALLTPTAFPALVPRIGPTGDAASGFKLQLAKVSAFRFDFFELS